jgi:hypothetical protein
MDNKRVLVGVVVGLLWVGCATVFAGKEEPPLSRTTEVISVLRSHYVDRDKLDDKLLNEATVAGLLQALGEGAVIVSAESTEKGASQETGPAATGPLARVEIIEPEIGYIRIADVVAATVSAVDAELKKFADAHVIGYVLDLRFADGHDYEAAATLASRFIAGKQKLFELKSADSGVQEFRAQSSPLPAELIGAGLSDAPLTVLVNAQTRGSAEALVGALRGQERGIVIGGKTAGSAAAWRDVKLSDGRVLRVATAKIVLPAKGAERDRSGEIFPRGIDPDVFVQMDPAVERDVLFGSQPGETLTASLQPREKRKGLSEADLAKVFRGEPVPSRTLDRTGEAEAEEGDIQQVRDVVLQRAVDILKGIRVLLSWGRTEME